MNLLVIFLVGLHGSPCLNNLLYSYHSSRFSPHTAGTKPSRSVHHHLWKTTYFAGNAVSFGEGTVFFYFAKTKKYIEVFANILEAQPPLVSGRKSPPNGRKFKPSSPPHLASARSLLCPCHANFAQLVLLTLWNGDLQSCIGTYKYRNKSLEIYFEYTVIFCSLQ